MGSASGGGGGGEDDGGGVDFAYFSWDGGDEEDLLAEAMAGTDISSSQSLHTNLYLIILLN